MVRPGAVVSAGTVLLRLSNPELEQSAQDVEYQLRAAEADTKNLRVRLESERMSQQAAASQSRLRAGEPSIRHRRGALAKEGLIPALNLKLARVKTEGDSQRYRIEQQRLEVNGPSTQAQLAAQHARVLQLQALSQSPKKIKTMAQALVTDKPGSVSGLRFTRTAAAAGLLLLAIFFALLSVSLQRPPAAVSTNAPATEFSSGRAMQHLNVIAREPRPLRTPAHARVRQYVSEQLTALGLNVEVQNNTVINNVVARLAGTNHAQAVLLVAHYDTVNRSPGAGDDGAAVASLLETARALKSGVPLRNDVVFLFTDGEEGGQLGAKAFAVNHAWKRDVRLALNFDARGNRGAAVMFETSNRNGWLVRQFADVAPSPVANSLMYDIYKLLPHDTDFTVFKEEGLAGLNFANIDGDAFYHTADDTLAHLDERTLQHQGAYALALARHFGDANLDRIDADDAVYFNLLGTRLVVYSVKLVLPLAALTALALAGLLTFGLKRKRLTVAGMAAGFAAFLLSMAGVLILTTFVWQLIRALRLGAGWNDAGVPFQVGLYIAGFAALATALTTAVFLLFHSKVNGADLMAGGFCWWLVLLVASSIYLPGGSYLFTWPLLASLAAFGLMLAGGEDAGMTFKRFVLLACCAVLCVVLLAPMIHLLGVALTLVFVGPVMMLVPLLVGLLLPQLDPLLASQRWRAPGVATLVGIVCLVAAHF